jgi:hypothetical protein
MIKILGGVFVGKNWNFEYQYYVLKRSYCFLIAIFFQNNFALGQFLTRKILHNAQRIEIKLSTPTNVLKCDKNCYDKMTFVAYL